MLKSKKKRGRPKVGVGTFIGLRLRPEIVQALDEHRRNDPELPTRSQAIRKMIETALRGKR